MPDCFTRTRQNGGHRNYVKRTTSKHRKGNPLPSGQPLLRNVKRLYEYQVSLMCDVTIGLAKQERRLLEALPGGASEAGGSQPGFAEGSEQTSSFARCCKDGPVGDCKDGRVKIGQIISPIMASGFFLVGSGDCKDGRDKSDFTPDSSHITMIAKKDMIDRRFFC